LAKNRIRCPENQLKTSCGVPWRYELIWSWKVLWSTVFSLTLVPVALVKAALIAWMPLSSAGSEWFEPTETVPPEADVEPEFVVPHAARKAAAAAALPPSLSSSRRYKLLPRMGTGMPTSLGDGERREVGVSRIGLPPLEPVSG